MRTPAPLDKGITLLEIIILIVVIAVLASLAIPYVTRAMAPRDHFSGISNARQIHQATMAMAIDGETNKDPSLGWPGDLKTKGYIATLEDFANVLVRNDYLKAGDLKIFASPRIQAYAGTLSSNNNVVALVPAFTDANSAYKVYLVKDGDPSDTVFLATKNYTYNTPLNDPNAKPYGDRGFVICRKGGDARTFKKEEVQALQLIGKLPGGGTVESAANCLNPGKPAP